MVRCILKICKKKTKKGLIARNTTDLPAKSDSDVIFCLQSYQGQESIDHVCINPIRRIGLIHKLFIDPC